MEVQGIQAVPHLTHIVQSVSHYNHSQGWVGLSKREVYLPQPICGFIHHPLARDNMTWNNALSRKHHLTKERGKKNISRWSRM